MSKIVEAYGIKMTSYEEIKFSKWLDNSKIAMNTLSKEKRTEIVTNWLNENRI